MLKRYQLLITKKYIKSFFTIFIALTLIFTGVDFISNLDKIPQSANLKVLFAVNRLMYFTTFTFGLSLIFAFIFAMTSLIKENELVVMYSFGASKGDLLKPFLVSISLFIVIFWILNNFSSFVSAKQVSDNIRKYGHISKYESGLFLKSKESYIYISRLNKFKKEGENIEIFVTKGKNLKKVIKAKQGIFKENSWLLKDVKVINIPSLKDGVIDKKLDIKYLKSLSALEGFKPSIMDSLYKGATGLTIANYFEALSLLKDKELNINSLKANLYQILFFPLFSLFLGVILFFKFPIQRRGENLGLITAKLYFIALMTWGILYMFIQMSKNAVILPEIGIIIPILLLGLYSFLYFRKKSSTF